VTIAWSQPFAGASDRETEAVVRWMMDALVDAALCD